MNYSFDKLNTNGVDKLIVHRCFDGSLLFTTIYKNRIKQTYIDEEDTKSYDSLKFTLYIKSDLNKFDCVNVSQKIMSFLFS